MLALYLSPLYILVNLYIGRWLLRWMGACSHHFKKRWVQSCVIVIYVFFATSMLTGFFMPHGSAERFLKLTGNYWLGVMLYVVLIIVIADLARWALKHMKRVNQEKLSSRRTFVTAGTFCILFIAVITVGGAWNARVIHTTDYEVKINKNAGKLQEMKVVLVADLHMGYNIGHYHIAQMVKKINQENPDLVVIAGDIFDNEYQALDRPELLISELKQIHSTYGVYACYGNHDIQEKILAGFTFPRKGEKKVSSVKMDDFLNRANIHLLKDKGTLIDQSFYLYGRADAERPGRGIHIRKTPKQITETMDTTLPILVMDHEPRQLKELADAGVDLDLCGHTHDGQLFPLNLSSRLMWENSKGYLKRGNMHNIVTSGVGLYGPNMRVATIAEICSIKVKFR